LINQNVGSLRVQLIVSDMLTTW